MEKDIVYKDMLMDEKRSVARQTRWIEDITEWTWLKINKIAF